MASAGAASTCVAAVRVITSRGRRREAPLLAGKSGMGTAGYEAAKDAPPLASAASSGESVALTCMLTNSLDNRASS